MLQHKCCASASKNQITTCAVKKWVISSHIKQVKMQYLCRTFQRIPVDTDGIVRHFFDAADESHAVLRIYNYINGQN